jgi:HNH endonuclease
MTQRKLTESQKKNIAAIQFYKCANQPNKTLKGLENYKCLLWTKNDEYKGSFDESGYEIDHIDELSISKNDNVTNLQALCKGCHAVKTKRFLMNKNKIGNKNDYKKSLNNDDDDILITKCNASSKKFIRSKTKRPADSDTDESDDYDESDNDSDGTESDDNYAVKSNNIPVTKKNQSLFKNIFTGYSNKQLGHISIIVGSYAGGSKQKIINRIIKHVRSYYDLTDLMDKIDTHKKYLITCNNSIYGRTDCRHFHYTNESIIKKRSKKKYVKTYCEICDCNRVFYQSNNEFYEPK